MKSQKTSEGVTAPGGVKGLPSFSPFTDSVRERSMQRSILNIGVGNGRQRGASPPKKIKKIGKNIYWANIM